MASKAAQIPADAILITEQQATGFAWEIVNGWNEGKDTWALRFGAGALGGLCSAGATFINSHFRTRVKLGRIGVMSSLLPTIVLPGVFSVVFHRLHISTNILLEKKNTCLLCYEIPAVTYQLLFAVAYPMVMAPLSCFMIANRYNTIRLPSIVKQPKELFKFIYKISKSQGGLLSTLILINTAVTSIITYYELKNHLTVKYKCKSIEEKMDSNIAGQKALN